MRDKGERGDQVEMGWIQSVSLQAVYNLAQSSPDLPFLEAS